MKYIILIAFVFIATCAVGQPGRIDKTFGNQDMVVTDFYGRYDYLTALEIQSDGKILAAGYSCIDESEDTVDFALARYNPDGNLDKSFASNGKAICHFGIGTYECTSLILQKDNKIIMAGFYNDGNNGAQFLLARFNPDGTLDNTFGSNGKMKTHFPTASYSASFALQDDQKIVMAGIIYTTALNGTYNNVLIRVNQDGSLDNTFGNSGVAILDSTYIYSIALQNDGKIVVSGVSYKNGSYNWSHITLIRCNSNGNLDKSFGNSGKINTDYISGLNSNLQILKDNKILIGTNSLGKDTSNLTDSFILIQFSKDGVLDSSFGVNGIVLQKIAIKHRLNSLIVPSDGKIYFSGSAQFQNVTQGVIVRCNADGSLDNTFGNNGIVFDEGDCRTIALQENKILVSTSLYPGWDFAIKRINDKGSIDNSFSSFSGIITLKSPGDDEANSISIPSDDRILLGGHSELSIDTSDLIAIRYNSGGDIDPRFWSAGKLSVTSNMKYLTVNSSVIQSDESVFFAGSLYDPFIFAVEFAFLKYSSNNDFKIVSTTNTDFGGGLNYCQSLLQQTDGKFVLSGYAFTDRNYDFALARYSINGSLDSSFGTAGKVTTDIGVNQDYAYASALQTDGKIILCGTTYNDKQWQIALIRYNSDGSLDHSFGSSGIVVTAFHDSDDEAKSIAIQSDGKIIVAGYTRNNKIYNFALVRYNTNGELDSTFGKSGIVETPIGSGDAEANGVVIEKDGKIVAAGYAFNGKDDDFALACYNPDGSLDKHFGTGGITTTDFGYGNDHGNAVALQSDGAIVVAGYAFNGMDKDYAVARYLPDLSLGVIDRKSTQNITTIYPNPIHNTATLQYELTQTQPITIKLFDILGNERVVLMNNEIRSEGKNSEQIIFPNGIAAGSYYLRIETKEALVTVKVIKSEP